MRLTPKAISKGNHWGYHTIADIGRAELIHDMGVDAKLKRMLLLMKQAAISALSGSDMYTQPSIDAEFEFSMSFKLSLNSLNSKFAALQVHVVIHN